MQLSVAEDTLIRKDAALASVILANGTIVLPPARGYYEALARAVIGQQISVKAATKIFERFEAATAMNPEKTLDLSDEQIKAIGLSGQKARYIFDLAQHFSDDSAVFAHLGSLDDAAVILELTKIKGIGLWTAQMFLLFTLHRPDVFAPDDRGLQLAVERLYERTFTRAELTTLAEAWAPHRSTASLHLWQSLENTPSSP